MNKLFQNIKNWINKNPAEFWVLLCILLVSAFLRLYKIDQFMTFLGDEGRDVIVVRRLLVAADPILIGPGTSIGGMYLGPLYYYMMAPALLLAGFSPVGPAVQVALLGVVTVWLLWLVAREWFGKQVAMIAALLYGISPTVIHFSRSSWNPNIMPFFSLVTVYSAWKIFKGKFNWIIILGVSFAFVLQSHYLGLILAPLIFFIMLITFLRIKDDNKVKSIFLKKSLTSLLLFMFLMSPLLIFDIRHDWMNTRALYKFFTVRQETVSARPWSSLPKIPQIFTQINTSLPGGKNPTAGSLVSGIFIFTLVLTILKNGKGVIKTAKENPGLTISVFWIFFALVGFGVYKQQIYDHYYGFIFVVPYLLIAFVVSVLLKSSRLLKIGGVILLVYLLYVNILENPLKYHPNDQMGRSKRVATKILEESGGKPFDLAVLAERNYEDGYRYFLEIAGATVLHADRWNKDSIADQLFVVCEMPKEKCDPTHSPKAEVANFGMSKIEMQWEESGVIIYKLIHSQ